ncbi:rod shape-determining protein RodA [Rubrobacter aplysinae]|uniref:rod shape-determining protein RodA n=1 Tax=Rubrobacter aplysinae TaxID=909625 RepID=UPI00064C15B5|nr:rod shape-determining protein RodA [Rubrobacter aplysinae]
MDLPLLLAGLGLSAFGVFAMYIVDTDTGYDYASNQFLGFLGGSVIALMLVILDYRDLKRFVWWLYGAGMLSLLAVLAFGVVGGGAQSWINVGPLQVQPSELVKLVTVLALATYLSQNAAGNLRVFLGSLGLVCLPTLLILAQPDLGTALVLVAVFVIVVFTAGARLWQMLGLGAVGAGIAYLSVKLGILRDYQLSRLTSFVDPEASPGAVGYQVLQSQNAIGSGGITGKGLDAATLANLGFLPEEQTDFIFANVAERLGFIGGVVVLALFFVLIWRILRVAATARDRFGVLVAVGIGTIFLFHLVVNVGMTMGIMPVTGIPLPFISYGRSSLIVSLISLGILQSIAARSSVEEGG